MTEPLKQTRDSSPKPNGSRVKRPRINKKVHELRVKSRAEFNKFEKNIPQLLQLLKSHSVTKKLTFSTEIHKDPLFPKIRFKYSRHENFSETDITVEPGSFEFDFEDGFNKINELTAYKASKLLQDQVIKEVNVWNNTITLLSESPSAPQKRAARKNKS